MYQIKVKQIVVIRFSIFRVSYSLELVFGIHCKLKITRSRENEIEQKKENCEVFIDF